MEPETNIIPDALEQIIDRVRAMGEEVRVLLCNARDLHTHAIDSLRAEMATTGATTEAARRQVLRTHTVLRALTHVHVKAPDPVSDDPVDHNAAIECFLTEDETRQIKRLFPGVKTPLDLTKYRRAEYRYQHQYPLHFNHPISPHAVDWMFERTGLVMAPEATSTGNPLWCVGNGKRVLGRLRFRGDRENYGGYRFLAGEILCVTRWNDTSLTGYSDDGDRAIQIEENKVDILERAPRDDLAPETKIEYARDLPVWVIYYCLRDGVRAFIDLAARDPIGLFLQFGYRREQALAALRRALSRRGLTFASSGSATKRVRAPKSALASQRDE